MPEFHRRRKKHRVALVGLYFQRYTMANKNNPLVEKRYFRFGQHQQGMLEFGFVVFKENIEYLGIHSGENLDTFIPPESRACLRILLSIEHR